jgi:hypothetical protein
MAKLARTLAAVLVSFAVVVTATGWLLAWASVAEEPLTLSRNDSDARGRSAVLRGG